MTAYRTPGVFVQQEYASLFPITQADTAIPAFLGYTRIAQKQVADDLLLKPVKISSLAQFVHYFGSPEKSTIHVTDNGAGGYSIRPAAKPEENYLLYYSVAMFFGNGGRACSIISVGTNGLPSPEQIKQLTALNDLQAGLNKLAKEGEPTLIVIPEAVLLPPNHFQILAREVLKQCGTLRDRFAIFDLYDGGLEPDGISLRANRDYFGEDHLRFGAAYYPFLKAPLELLKGPGKVDAGIRISIEGSRPVGIATVQKKYPDMYQAVKNKLQECFVILPPSGAIAGVYSTVDHNRGVWKAPANESLRNGLCPAVAVDSGQQDLFHVDPVAGKSINVIREFPGRGTVVWGARTLAGNDNEWRYVSVRRFYSMVEESITRSTRWVVFEPNDANTWVKVHSAIENFLTTLWRQGALAGAKPDEAFFVRCGLGSTMTPQDILEGRMIMEIGLAVSRPGEFVILRIAHKMQEA